MKVAAGRFFVPGLSVMSGSTSIKPTSFDGTKLQVFGNAGTLLMVDDLNLVEEDSSPVPLGVKSSKDDGSYSIANTKVSATPRPDGNSIVEATFTLGNSFKPESVHPLLLMGTQLYGLHETPFLNLNIGPPCESQLKANVATETKCKYRFIASTSVLRSAQTFKLADLAWDGLRAQGPIQFDPAIQSLVPVSEDDQDSDSQNSSTQSKNDSLGKAKKHSVNQVQHRIPRTPASKKANVPQSYVLTGTDVDKLRFCEISAGKSM